MTVTDDIKARLDIVEVISETVKLRRTGSAHMGLCPFHAHKNNTPSFAVWPDTGTWRCFGQCNEGGDVFKFVMKRDNVDFGEALRLLAARAGVELRPRSPEERERDEGLDRLRGLLDTAATYFHHLLKNAPQAGHARDHLARRGLTDQAVELFQLGYALDSWDAGLKYLTDQGYSRQDLSDAGLIVEKDDGKVFDRFRDRLMIPVRDALGRMTGFQARALQAEAVPKFMNSPQTALFDKGRTLFGLHLARKAIREAGAAIVVEGNLDVIAAHQAGFANVVSSQGTALTEHQLRLLKKQAKRLILALDADEAGDAATLRGLSVAREALDREAEITFDPRGLVKTEGRLGADIRVLTLPAGLDPDEVIGRDPDEWRALVDAAEPVVAYVIRVLTSDRDLDDPKTKTEIANTVLPLIDDVAQPIERDTYRQQLARTLRVDVRSLAATRPQVKPRLAPRAPAPKPESPAAAAPTDEAALPRLETYCLGSLLRRPELVYRIDRDLQDLALPKLADDDFAATPHQAVFRGLAAALEQVEVEHSDYLRDNLDPALQPYAESLMSEAESEATDESKTADALLSAVLRLRGQRVRQQINRLRFLMADLTDQGQAVPDDYFQQAARNAELRDRIDRALARRSRRGDAAAAPQAAGW